MTDNLVGRRKAIEELNREHVLGHSPFDGAHLEDRLERLLAGRFARVDSANAPELGAGDVELSTPEGTVYIEIKAQLEKQQPRDITQVDWVRNDTDALRFLARSDSAFRQRLSVESRARLAVIPNSLDGWSFPSLWLADIALLTSSEMRTSVGVNRPEDLGPFLRRKYLLHMWSTGERWLRLAEIDPVARALNEATSVSYSLKRNSKSEVAVPVKVGAGGVIFTYHLYPNIGRHKVHARLFDVS